LVNSYTGWQNGAPVGYASTSATQTDVRITNVSTGYTNASGGGNIFLGTATNAARNFIISGINTSNYQNIKLVFGLRKEGSGTDTLLVEASSDGVNYTPLYITQPTGFSAWSLVTTTGIIPTTPNLRIRISKNSTLTQFRIDDFILSYTNTTASISTGSSTTFCQGGSISLTASTAPQYTWSNNATTQSISVSTSGNYFVTETSSNGCSANSNTIGVTVNPLPSVTGFTPTSGASGTLVTINGSGFTGTSSVKFNGTTCGFNVVNGSQITATVPAGATSGTIAVTNSCGAGTSVSSFTVATTLVIQLRVFLEGFYAPHDSLLPVLDPAQSPQVCDLITVALVDSASLNEVASVSGNISTHGFGNFIFNAAALQSLNKYFIVVRHRNSVETWSKNAYLMNGSTFTYDFTR
jgi:hypothetical protein